MGRFLRGIESAERDLEALRLKSRGWTLEQISDDLGYGSRANVSRAIKRAAAEVPMPGVEVYRRMQLETIDYALRVVIEIIETDHPFVTTAGVIVKDGEKTLLDDAPRLAAVRELRALLERQAKTTGSDAPAQRVVTLDDLHAERARLLAEEAEYDDEDDEDPDDESEPVDA